ncbi:MAG: NAD(P)/FAD-dependent oxidoreductase [Actinobacteria bacterium]|nr:NAD(P)/FAD-dependent oxidoreductase [Actinomycetota bacterium]MBM3712794.1 NAD(P)/FAD-dependent oxidoreductase [Actinomycetota bacterium]
MSEFYDVVISGCGPSGSLLGYLLSQSNIKTLIIEKENFPRQKICAGGIQHRTLSLIPFKIDDIIEKTIFGIYFSLKNKDIFFRRNDNPILYTVNRARFDSMLAQQAGKEGCIIKFGEKVESFTCSSSYVEIKTSRKKYRTKVLVGADGIRGTVHRNLLGRKKINKILAYETELSYKDKGNDKGNDIIEDNKGNVFNFCNSVRLDFNGVKRGYCWVFPKKNFLSCGMGAPFHDVLNMKKYFKNFLTDFYLDGKYKNIGPKIYAHGIPLKDEDTPICNFRVLAVGDAACLGDGFTGEGLFNSIKSSCIASECIIHSLRNSNFYFKDYEERIKNDIYRDIKISFLLTKIFYSSLLLIYKLLLKNDNYFYACCKILRGEKSYKDVVDKLKILKLR